MQHHQRLRKTKGSFHATSETVEKGHPLQTGDPNPSITHRNCLSDRWQWRHPERATWEPCSDCGWFPKSQHAHCRVTRWLYSWDLLPLLQPRAQKVCSCSKLKRLELETIRDTFSPCGYQHFVPLSPSSLQGMRQQRQARELGRGMGTLVGGGMSPAAWQDTVSPPAIAVPFCIAAEPGRPTQTLLSAKFLFYPRRQEASLSNSVQE